MESIKEFLESIGFGKNETEIYIALVELGTSSVLDISKYTKIHRSNIYDALRSLVQKGLVFEINEATKTFAARPPESLSHYMKIREAELGEVIKNYTKNFSNKKSQDMRIKVSKGLYAAKEAIFNLLNAGTQHIDVYGIPIKAAELIGPIIKEFHLERIKKGIFIRQIYNSDAMDQVEKINKLKLTQAKTLPAKYNSEATTNIAGDKITIILWQNGLTVIEIEDESLAGPYKAYFDILWKKAKLPNNIIGV